MACADDGEDPPPPTTISITAGGATALIAFRDGPQAAWQSATKRSETSYEIVVHGPYVAAVACDYGGGVEVSQIGRSLDDDHDLGTVCPKSTGSHRVSGHMAQAGWMAFGQHLEGAVDPNWEFQFLVDNGTYDLLALTSDRIAAQRHIVVTGDLVISPTVDVTQGAALAGAAFTANNAAAGEALQASVMLGAEDTALLDVYRGPIATAKVAPETALIASDQQTVSVQGRTVTGNRTTGRALRRPFRVGGNTAYTLPPPMSGTQWTVDTDQPAVSWSPGPDAYYLIASLSWESTDHRSSYIYFLDLSAAYLDATGITHATLASDIPGYKPEWKFAPALDSTRELEFQNVTDGVIATVWQTDAATAQPLTAAPASRARTLGAQR
jgi:hypothetical protein